jgi:hypothetical protein
MGHGGREKTFCKIRQVDYGGHDLYILRLADSLSVGPGSPTNKTANHENQ